MTPSDLHGRWQLISYVQLCDGAVIAHPLGETPQGLLLYTPDGGMSGFLSEKPGPGRIAKHLAYAGSWRLEGQTVRHAVAFNTEPERIGQEVVRQAHFEGRDLVLETPKKATPKGTVWLRLVWRRF